MNLLGEIIDKMKKAGWFLEAIKKTDTKQLLSEALIEGDPPPFRKSQIMDVIEYGRAVHAEMAAISSAANRGVSIKGCDLYSTTFPCHECARHIVASGLRRVYYIEPYPKSLVIELYSDSIAINGDIDKLDKVHFIPFDGIAPRLYMKLFLGDKKREKKLGEMPKWDNKSAEPIVLDNASLNVLLNEQKAIDEIYKLLEGNGISFQKGG
jgi:cytidine deaminase